MASQVETAYIGFDCSSKAIHCVILDSDFNLVVQKKWGSKKKLFDNRFPEFANNFYEDLSKIIIHTGKEKILVAIEQAIFIQNPKTTVEIANVIGCVRAVCYVKGFDVTMVDNRRWKKSVVGKGNAKKPEILSYAIERWGDVFVEQDFADAACIAAWRIKEEMDEKE